MRGIWQFYEFCTGDGTRHERFLPIIVISPPSSQAAVASLFGVEIDTIFVMESIFRDILVGNPIWNAFINVIFSIFIHGLTTSRNDFQTVALSGFMP